MSGSADRRTALLPQQGGTASCGSRRGRQSVQPAHCAEGATGGTVLYLCERKENMACAVQCFNIVLK